MELWERGAGECCGVSTSLPPPMLELNTDCGVPVNTLTSFSSSLIFSLLLGELRSEEWTSCCCCCMGLFCCCCLTWPGSAVVLLMTLTLLLCLDPGPGKGSWWSLYSRLCCGSLLSLIDSRIFFKKEIRVGMPSTWAHISSVSILAGKISSVPTQ